MLENAAERGAFELTIIRPAHTYSDDRTPLPFIGSGVHLLKRIRQEKPIIVLGNGTSFWASAHRDDVGPTFVAAIGNPNVYNKAYHVAAEEWMTWEQHFQTVADAMGAPSIQFAHIPTDLLGRMAPKAAEWSVVNFTYNNIFDNTAAKRDLNYQYTISWQQGVKGMIAYHDQLNLIERCPDDTLYNKLVDLWGKISNHAVAEMKSFSAQE
jgi:nucleoside-diphosphate-sugar epimerase